MAKARKRYPMIVGRALRRIAHGLGVLRHILPQLEKIEAGCAATTDAAQVRSIIDPRPASN